MSATVLGNLALGYQLVWGRARTPRAVHLRVEATVDEAVDAAHLLRILAESWTGQSPQLILSTPELWLLREFLQHVRSDGAWIAVHQSQLQDAAIRPLVHEARRRGAVLLWRGEPGEQPSMDSAGAFARGMVALTAGEALWSLHASRQRQQPGAADDQSPVIADQIYEAVPGLALARHCLDEQGAWGVAGWPEDDVLMRGHQQQMQPDRDGIRAVIATVDADASMERIEQEMDTQPVLVYRFMLYMNSASLGLRNPAESLRHGLMMLGLSNFRGWLQAQLHGAGNDIDLLPIRSAMVLRAHLTESLLDAGEEDKLRRELYLCSLLAEVPRMLGEPLPTVLGRLELPERITSALFNQSGVYAPFMAVANALSTIGSPSTVPALCAEHEMDLAEVNRALLRVLAQLRTKPAG